MMETSLLPISQTQNYNKKLRYREKHSASVMLSWYTLTFLGRISVDG